MRLFHDTPSGSGGDFHDEWPLPSPRNATVGASGSLYWLPIRHVEGLYTGLEADTMDTDRR